MNEKNIIITRVFDTVTKLVFTLAASTIMIQAQSGAAQTWDDLNLIPGAPALGLEAGESRFVSVDTVNVSNIEELYSAVNNPLNAGNRILVAPGVYILSVTAPGGSARPNSGRLE